MIILNLNGDVQGAFVIQHMRGRLSYNTREVVSMRTVTIVIAASGCSSVLTICIDDVAVRDSQLYCINRPYKGA